MNTPDKLRTILEDEFRLVNLDLAIREIREPAVYNAVKAAMRRAWDAGINYGEENS